MSSAEVQQLSALSDLFAKAIRCCRPLSVAVLGIAGGNGLDQIDSSVTGRVVGLDLNPLYLQVVRQRYPHLRGLELYCVDLSEPHLELKPVQLVHAALIFEYAGLDCALENASSMVMPGGNLSVVLQLPSGSGQAVTASQFPSLQRLKSHLSLISPRRLRDALEERGFQPVQETTLELPARKGFWAGMFSAPPAPHRK